MALRRHSMASARRIQSQRRLWIRVSDNEPGDRKEVHWKKVFLESENATKDKDQKET